MSLPWLSSEALLKGWERVRENDGCAGADGITVTQFARSLDTALDSRGQKRPNGPSLKLLSLVKAKGLSSIA